MWVVYALLSAFFIATTDPIAKSALRRGVSEYTIGWLMIAFSVPFLAAYYAAGPTAHVTADLVKILAVIMPFEVLAAILYYKAIKLTDISLSVPFLALTPVFIIFTAYFILGEHINIAGGLGIALITAGVYSLNLKEAKYGFVKPVKAIFINKGSLYMVLVAIIFSITAVMCKKAMLLSNPQSIPFIYNLAITLSMLPFIIYMIGTKKAVITWDGKSVIAYATMGVCLAISNILFFKAISMQNTSYVVSIKRLSLAMSVLYGWTFFKEKDIHIRLTSTICMLAGIVLVVIG